MKAFVQLEMAPERSLPSKFTRDAHVRFSENLVRYLLEEMTVQGDVVFDPFAGFDTTLIVAEEMKRQAFGVELNEERAEYVKSHLEHPDRLIVGDSSNPTSFESVPAAAL
jgi:hypothetical protein